MQTPEARELKNLGFLRCELDGWVDRRRGQTNFTGEDDPARDAELREINGEFHWNDIADMFRLLRAEHVEDLTAQLGFERVAQKLLFGERLLATGRSR